MKPRLNPFLVLSALSLASAASWAEDRIKADNATALNLSESWTDGIPGNTDTAVWNATVTSANTVDLGADASWQGLTIANPGGSVTVNGTNLLTLGAGGINIGTTVTTTANLVFNPPIAFAAAQTWNIASSRSATLGGSIDAAGNAFTKSGSGTLVWQGATSNLPSISLTGGALRAAEGTGFPAATSISISSGVLESSGTMTRGIGNGPGLLRITGGTSGFSANGGTLTLNFGESAADLIWGSADFNPGTLVLQNYSATSLLEVQNGIDLRDAFRTFDVRGNVALVSGVVSGTAGFTLNGSNSSGTSNTILRFSNTNTYQGRTVIANTSGGRTRLAFSVDENLGAVPASPFTDNIVLVTGGVLQADETVTLNPNRHLAIGSSGGGNAVTGGISVASGKHLTIPGPIADRTLNAFDTVISNPSTGSLQKHDSGHLLLLNEASTYTGGTIVSGGNLAIRKISDGGQPSTIGAGGNAATNLNFNGGRLQYHGNGDSTDRLFTVSAANTTLESSGSGPLHFTNTGANITTSSGGRNLNLTGYASGNTLASSFSDGTTTGTISATYGPAANQITVSSTTGIAAGQYATSPSLPLNATVSSIAGNVLTLNTNTGGTAGNPLDVVFNTRLNLTKTGSGSWTLSGNNTHTGLTRLRGGELILDYNGNGGASDPIAFLPTLVAEAGTLAFQARPTGVTADTLDTLRLGEAHFAFGRTELRKGAGEGFHLTVDYLESSGGATQRHDLLDLSSGPGNAITINHFGLTTGMANGVIMNNTTNSGTPRASIVLRDTDGTYGFPTVATLPGTLSKMVPIDVEPATGLSSANNTVNQRFTAGEYSTTAAAYKFSTLTFDSASGPIDLTLGGSLAADGLGKATLFSGPSDVSITGTTPPGSALWFHNHLSGDAALHIGFPLGTTQTIMFGGTGFSIYSGIGFGNNFMTNGSNLRVTAAQDISSLTTSNIRVTSGAVFEIGADLNGTAEGDLSNTVGESSGNFRFLGDSGLSAWTEEPGGLRVVNFGNGQSLTWGAAAFLANTQDSGYDGDYTLKLSSDRSNATIELKNSINLNNRNRVIEVAAGTNDPAASDAVLSGVLSGTAIGFTKTGPGILSLTGRNTYTGETHVSQGILRLNGSSLSQSSRLRLSNDGSVEITGTLYVSAVTIDGLTALPGPVSHPRVTGNLIVGEPSGIPPYDQWVTANHLPSGKDEPMQDSDDDGIPNLIEYAVNANPSASGDIILSMSQTSPPVVAFRHWEGKTDISVFVESSPDLAADNWTTIASGPNGTIPAAIVDEVMVTGVVPPTNPLNLQILDARPSDGKLFYRLRVTK